MSYNVISEPASSVTDVDTWLKKYKEQHIEVSHDQSLLTLATPDDSLVVVGPPRLQGSVEKFFVVGLLNQFQYSESAQVQPIKPIGSRRHLFSKTNMPVSGSIGRMIILGNNLFRALYALTDAGAIETHKNSKYAQGYKGAEASWYANLEEDIFRLPIGLGVIYNAPITANEGSGRAVGAEYLEVCVLQNRAVGLQSGQTLIMEQVSFMADRVVPWDAYRGAQFSDSGNANPAADLF